MSNHFGVGVAFGALAALTPPFAFLSVAIGLYALARYGLTAPGESATAGVVWASAWAVVYYGAALALLALVVGVWLVPVRTGAVAGTLLLLAALRWYMTRTRGDANGAV